MGLRELLERDASDSLVRAIKVAIEQASAAKRKTSLAFLASALLADEAVRARLGDETADAAQAAMSSHTASAPSGEGAFDFDLEAIAQAALSLTRDFGGEKATPVGMLAAIVGEAVGPGPEVRAALQAAGVVAPALLGARDPAAAKRRDFTFAPLGFGQDITEMARAGVWTSNPCVGMDRELERLAKILSSGEDSAVVVGEPGVGKSAVVNGLAWHLANGDHPKIRPDVVCSTIVLVTMKDLVAGASAQGQLEERLTVFLDYCAKNPSVAPFFDEIHQLLNTQEASSRAIATALKIPMSQGVFRCIGATTDAEYARFIAGDEAMNSRFTRILIPEPSVETTESILAQTAPRLLTKTARRIGLTVAPEALAMTVRITGRYQRDRRNPRKSIELLRQSIVDKSFNAQTEPEAAAPELSAQDVAATFSDVSGVPVDELTTDKDAFFKNLGARLNGRVLGQEPAVSAVARWLALHARGWVDKRRPRGRFLFLGPPGVGKTELATAIAEEVMQDRGSMITRGMAEYKGEGARSRFMGSDPGYVGFGEVSTIYSEVMMRPYAVVVLDEFEKAHAELAGPMISVLDGRGADARGKETDFAQCVFLLTSNAIASVAELGLTQDDLALEPEARRKKIDARIRARLLALGGIWTAPLLDRIDRIVIFNTLSEGILRGILDQMIAKRRDGAATALPAAIDAPETKDEILALAHDPEAGAPSARRLESALVAWLDTAMAAELAADET